MAIPDETAKDTPPLRTELWPGDLGEIVRLHGVLYAREHGFDHTFEAYLAGPLARFALSGSTRERIWIAEHGDRLVGCVGIVERTPDEDRNPGPVLLL